MSRIDLIREELSFDNEDDSLIVKRIQDCTPFLERAHYLREHADQWRGEGNDFWHAASVPNVVIEEWMQKGINIFREEDWPKVQAMLNGPYKYLKTMPRQI